MELISKRITYANLQKNQQFSLIKSLKKIIILIILNLNQFVNLRDLHCFLCSPIDLNLQKNRPLPLSSKKKKKKRRIPDEDNEDEEFK